MRYAIALLAFWFVMFGHVAMSDEIFVDTSLGGGQVGAFYGPYSADFDLPVPPSYPAILPPDNDPTFQNYFMGRSTIGGTTTPERRPFFIFDMASVSIPSGHVITSVTIDLELLPGGTSALANFSGGSEIVDFSSTTYTEAEILDPDSFAILPEDIWSTFGSTMPYGGFELFSGPSPPATTPATYTIPLPGAISDVSDAISTGDFFIVTARLASFDPDPIGATPPTSAPYEYVFGLTDVETPAGPMIAAPELTITTAIPEPSSWLMMSLLVVSVMCKCIFKNRD